jgi:hypothetical protein
MECGTKYESALISVWNTDAVAVTQEVYRSPNQTDANPFPYRDVQNYSTNVKDLIGYYIDEDIIGEGRDVEGKDNSTRASSKQNNGRMPFPFGKDPDNAVPIDD